MRTASKFLARPASLLSIQHVISAGQSLSVGGQGTPALSTSPLYAQYALESGYGYFVPLTEPPERDEVASGETIHSAMGRLITSLRNSEDGEPLYYPMLHSMTGISGSELAVIEKGGTGDAYQEGIDQVTAAKHWASPYRVAAIAFIHGERDHVIDTPLATYQSGIIDLYNDYLADLGALTGQADDLIMLVSQMSSWTQYNDTTSLIPYAQLGAVEATAGMYMVGPKYHLPYTDGLHLTNQGYRQLGEEFGKIYKRIALDGLDWKPVSPISAVRTGASIVATFNVPVAPLALDTTLVSNPGNYGFEFYDDGGPSASISSVSLTDDDEVTITLNTTPTGGGQKLRYAYTGTSGADAGPTTGARGNLRDSDATVSLNGYDLYNWCVHFDIAVTT